jgi:hypothetical protein
VNRRKRLSHAVKGGRLARELARGTTFRQGLGALVGLSGASDRAGAGFRGCRIHAREKRRVR